MAPAAFLSRSRAARACAALAAAVALLTAARLSTARAQSSAAPQASVATESASAASTQSSPAPQASAPAPAGKEVLINGDFAKGSGDQPDDWRDEAWVNAPEAFKTTWQRPENGHPGELIVENLKANDGRWEQSLSLEPGWYYFGAEIRTENVGVKETGATVSVLEDGAMSRDVQGTADWRRLGFYLKISGRGADVDVALRVGGYGSLNTGRAYFRNASVLKISALPPGATPVYDLAEIRKTTTPPQLGSHYSLVIAFLLLGVGAVWGWRRFGQLDQSNQPDRSGQLAASTSRPAPRNAPQSKSKPPKKKRAAPR